MSSPSTYTDKVGHIICTRLAAGETLRKICLDADLPCRATVHNWLLASDSFHDLYTKAREIQAHHLFDECLEIADSGSGDTMRDRLRVDTRKFYIAKVLPKLYGEKVAHELSGADGGPILTAQVTDAERARALAVFMARTKGTAPALSE